MFRAIKPKRIVDYIVEQIEDSIRKGELLPNNKLPSERELAKMFEVSRTSVREALNILQAKGLIVSSQGDGTFVRPLTDHILEKDLKTFIKDDPSLIWELMEIRKNIEFWAVKKACFTADENDLELLKDAFNELYEDFKYNRNEEQSDAEFHYSIIRATKNTVLMHMMSSIFKLLKEATNMGRSYEFDIRGLSRKELLDEHKAVFEAILKRDPNLAYEKMKKHLSYIDEHFKNYLYEVYNKRRQT